MAESLVNNPTVRAAAPAAVSRHSPGPEGAFAPVKQEEWRVLRNASPADATAGWPPPPPPPPPPVRGRKDGVAPGFEITSAHCGTAAAVKAATAADGIVPGGARCTPSPAGAVSAPC
ncbi:Krueppel-like factor 16 [Schistocerca nitens]|uniref:Krueppel-like factor 16 n=1 Tax=Schistocerca nitens TaxID=7011 RepID=UPI0021176DAB|nr:Krueppel-like factor 16 [Schistocerca nitens]